MKPTVIDTVELLREYLHRAMQIEHATIPPYLTAFYSIRPGTNSDACQILRVAMVEEMLHLTQAANLLNSIGGSPTLIAPGFVPEYPARLPNGETDFEVSLERFSPDAVGTFLKIERPSEALSEDDRRRSRRKHICTLVVSPKDSAIEYYSIGEFYEEVRRGFEYLYAIHGSALFSGDPTRQVGPEHYYSGGGDLHTVGCIDSARRAIRSIVEQGEGKGGGIYDGKCELAHFYRFDQLQQGQYYRAGDRPGVPTGPRLEVDWNSVLPIKTNARVAEYEGSPELYRAAVNFNRRYEEFLGALTEAFNGKPQLLLAAVPMMFRLRDMMLPLMNNPLPGATDQNAAPTFEATHAAEGGLS